MKRDPRVERVTRALLGFKVGDRVVITRLDDDLCGSSASPAGTFRPEDNGLWSWTPPAKKLYVGMPGTITAIGATGIHTVAFTPIDPQSGKKALYGGRHLILARDNAIQLYFGDNE